MSRRITPIAFMDSDRFSTFIEVRRAQIRRERLRFLGWCAAIVVLSVVVAWVVTGWVMS